MANLKTKKSLRNTSKAPKMFFSTNLSVGSERRFPSGYG